MKKYNDGVIAVMHVQIDVKGKNYIEANYCPEREVYYGMYLRVGKKWNADNEQWIFHTFLPLLKRFKKDRLSKEDIEDLETNKIDFISQNNVRDFIQAFKLFKKMTNYQIKN